MKSDEELMVEASSGNIEAYGEVVRRNWRSAYNLAYRLLKDPGEAENIAQEAFLKIQRRLEQYEVRAKFRTYLYRVVSRLCFDRTKKKKPNYIDKMPHDEATDRSSPLSEVVDKERQKKIKKNLDSLPDRQRTAIVLQVFHDMSYKKIAEVLETSAKAVERLLARARDSLAEKFSEELEID
ncbi:MAG: RNA polymerase sigma factor [bacterium]